MVRSVVPDGESWITLYRLADPSGLAYAPSGISDVEVGVYDLSGSAPSTNIYSASDPDPAVAFQTSLLTDYGWEEDSVGYNFRDVILPAELSTAPEGGHVYRVEYVITTYNDGVRVITHMVTVRGQYGG